MPAAVPPKPSAVFASQKMGYTQKIPDYDSRRAGINTIFAEQFCINLLPVQF